MLLNEMQPFQEWCILLTLRKVIKSLQEHSKIYYRYIIGEKGILCLFFVAFKSRTSGIWRVPV